MFLMPHDAGFVGVFARATQGGGAAWGVGLLVGGLAVASGGIAVARKRMQAAGTASRR
jgi:hypothetical protein